MSDENEKQLDLISTQRYLTPKEIEYWNEYCRVKDSNQAYANLHPGIKWESVLVGASRTLSRIKQKVNDPEYLDTIGMGKMRVLMKLNELMEAEKVQHFKVKKGKDLEEVVERRSPDLPTQLGATKLASEINNMKAVDGQQNNRIYAGKVLLVPGKLSEEEWQEQVKHVEKTGKIKNIPTVVTGNEDDEIFDQDAELEDEQ